MQTVAADEFSGRFQRRRRSPARIGRAYFPLEANQDFSRDKLAWLNPGAQTQEGPVLQGLVAEAAPPWSVARRLAGVPAGAGRGFEEL